jgi:hypothetical protein
MAELVEITYTVAEALDERGNVCIPALHPYRAMLEDQRRGGIEGPITAQLAELEAYEYGHPYIALFPRTGRACVIDGDNEPVWVSAVTVAEALRAAGGSQALGIGG